MKNMLKNKIFDVIKKYKFFFTLFILFNIISNSINDFIIPKRIGELINKLDSNTLNFEIVNNIIILVILYIILDFFTRYMYIFSFTRSKYKIFKDSFSYLQGHSVNFFDDNLSGSIGNKINSISSTIESILFSFINVITINFFVKSLILYSFFKISKVLFIFNLIWIIFYIFTIFYLNKFFKNKVKSFQEERNILIGNTIDTITNIKNVKVFANEKYEEEFLKKKIITTFSKEKVMIDYKIFLKVVCNVLSALPLLFNIYITTWLFINNKILLGDITFVIITSLNIIQIVKFIGNIIIDMFEQINRVKQDIETLYIPYEIQNNDKSQNLDIVNPSINVNNISFKYNTIPVFSNFSLSILPYQKVGIVGYSGAGKSTLVNLLLRFYDINDGEIIIDKYNIKEDITQESLRDNISYIPQDPILFHRTIKENILYGKLNATEEELIEATKKAYCCDFINTLENKFDTLVGERGVKLSGGQRQRIAIARAILKNSPILILDEATSSLDTITEKEIQKALNNLMLNKTVIVIAHRLSTLNNMDRIITIDKGQIIEDGTMQDLLNNPNGLFKKMYDMQKDGVLGK